tara:strand:+ start:83 stop:889 length:807 start_codon:yes stop_codon:yes gene_type:complete
MPEGPEVRKISESLAMYISNKTLLSFDILSGRYQKHGLPQNFDLLKSSLPKPVAGAGCHGKFIFIIFSDGTSIWCTLGMTGTWSEEEDKHSRVRFKFSDGSAYFSDMRNFGTLRFCETRSGLIEKIKSLGPDMLSEDVSDVKFFERVRSCNKKTVAQALMDQSVVAGVGNYLKAECLYFSKISPHRACDSLSDEELSRLNKSIKNTIRASYESGGATIQNYKTFEGNIGKYSRRFMVYNQKEDLDGNPVIKEKTRDGRVTHWVPKIQR